MKLHQATVGAAGMALVLAGMPVITITPTATAADIPAPLQEKFHKLDTNRDGYLSQSELKQFRGYAAAFDQADENHDGKLDADEFIKAEAIYQRLQAAVFVDDSVTTAKVKAALLKEPQLKSLDVSVETYRGHVLLSGFVDDGKQRAKALSAASSVNGVASVKDGLAVK